MSYRVAINGFGRIGRNFVRAALTRPAFTGPDIEIVAVNDLWPAPTLAHLLAHDSTFGSLDQRVTVDGDVLVAGPVRLRTLAEKDPAALPWGELDVDLVVESTGRFRTRADAALHLKAGARKVLISAPGKGVDATVVLGVTAGDGAGAEIVSAASCTTNCAAPMVKVLDDAFGVERGYLTTIHAYTNDQELLDSPHKDLRRARSAAVNMIPTSTGAAKAIGEVLPGVAGRLAGTAVRVPVENGSLTQISVELGRATDAEEVNAAFASAALGRMSGFLTYSESPLVSRDVVGDPSSCVFDSLMTSVQGPLATVFGWYDNEWGYTNRLVDLTERYAVSR